MDLPCGFVARSNAAIASTDDPGCSEEWRQRVMDRLSALENASRAGSPSTSPGLIRQRRSELEDSPFRSYNEALEAVLSELPTSLKGSEAWAPQLTQPLWNV